jgi:competence protein ComEA
MLKQLCAAALLAATAHAWAAVDINTASAEALQEFKGIGPARARALIDERDARGPFRNADDLAQRVRGFGHKTIERLRAAGLEIGAARPVTTLVRPLTSTRSAARQGSPAARR